MASYTSAWAVAPREQICETKATQQNKITNSIVISIANSSPPPSLLALGLALQVVVVLNGYRSYESTGSEAEAPRAYLWIWPGGPQ